MRQADGGHCLKTLDTTRSLAVTAQKVCGSFRAATARERVLVAAIVIFFAPCAFAAIDGTIMNGTTGKPQSGATVTLFQTTNQGPQNLGSVKSDAQGKFVFTQDVRPGVGGGPLLIQAVHGEVQYNLTIPPGSPMQGVSIPVYESTKTPGQAKIQQHFFVLEPSPQGTMQVTEGFLFTNDGKTTWNDPDEGTLQFELPAAAQGKMEINVTAPGGLPIRRSADPLGKKPNQYKLDFPIKPGETRVDLAWSMPFNSPGVFQDRVLSRANLIRAVAPAGVEFKGPDVNAIGSVPDTKATVYAVKGPDLQFDVEGTGLFNTPDDSGGGNANSGGGSGQNIAENFPKLYGLLAANASFIDSILAVKWVLLTIIGMLALAFILLYRKGDPLESAGNTAQVKAESETVTKASKHARSRG